MQFRLSAAENIPMVSMNSSTGIPFRMSTFLKTCSAIGCLAACVACVGCPACPFANPTTSTQAAVEHRAPKMNRLDPKIITVSLRDARKIGVSGSICPEELSGNEERKGTDPDKI